MLETKTGGLVRLVIWALGLVAALAILTKHASADGCIDANADGVTTASDALIVLGQATGTVECGTLRFAAIPDTQFYSRDDSGIFEAQTQWIAENVDYAAHLGDIVNTGSSDAEWMVADRAMGILDLAGVPYGVVPGNHDCDVVLPGDETCEQSENYANYFGPERFAGQDHFGPFVDGNTSHYDIVGGLMFLFLEYKATSDPQLLLWADAAIRQHRDKDVIVVTHYAMNCDGTLSDDGHRIMNGLADNPNLSVVLGGHVHCEKRAVHERFGNLVPFLVSNYQTRPNGGQGFLRVYDIDTRSRTIRAFTFSPTLNAAEVDADSNFTIHY